MSRLNNDINKILSGTQFKTLRSMGLIDEIALRNLIIKLEYKKLREIHSQIDSFYILTEKFFLSYDSINNILFRKRQKKSVFTNHFLPFILSLIFNYSLILISL